MTGAGGLLGRTLVPLWRAAGIEVVEWPRAVLDVTQADAVRDAVLAAAPDAVVHLAAYTNVDRAEAEPDQAMRVNAEGSAHVARACRDARALCVYVSSDYVLGGEQRVPLRPDAPLRPLGVYAEGKAAGERAVQAEAGHWLVARTGWVYGPHGRNFVDTMRGLAKEGKPAAVVDDQEGAPSSTRLIAAVLLRLVAEGRTGTWHVAPAGSGTWFDVARRVYRAAGAPETLVTPQSSAQARRAAPRPRYSVLDVRETAAALGHPLPPWERDVDAYVHTGELPANDWELN